MDSESTVSGGPSISAPPPLSLVYVEIGAITTVLMHMVLIYKPCCSPIFVVFQGGKRNASPASAEPNAFDTVHHRSVQLPVILLVQNVQQSLSSFNRLENASCLSYEAQRTKSTVC
jgi:hypothetical protein